MADTHCGSQNPGTATNRPADPAAGARTAMTETIREQKSALRRRIRNELARLSPGARLAASAQACSRLRQERIWREAGSVLLYAPLADEPDVEPLWRGALATGKTLALPRFDPETGSYQACRVLNPGEGLKPGQFGDPETGENCPLRALKRPDLIRTAWGGVTLGYWFYHWKQSKLHSVQAAEGKSLLENARREAEAVLREARFAASEEALKLREQTEKSFGTRRRELTDFEQRLADRESLINQQLEGLVGREKDLHGKQQDLEEKKSAAEAERNELVWLARLRREQLQKLSHLSQAEARALLLKEAEQEA